MSHSGPENRFIQSLHKLLPPHVYRMKNHNPYCGGVPDCWYSGGKSDLWVEYKFITPPKRESTIIPLTTGKNPLLSALQQEWLRGRHSEGRNVGVIIGTPKGGVWLPGLSWDAPIDGASFCSLLTTKQDLVRIICSGISSGELYDPRRPQRLAPVTQTEAADR